MGVEWPALSLKGTAHEKGSGLLAGRVESGWSGKSLEFSPPPIDGTGSQKSDTFACDLMRR